MDNWKVERIEYAVAKQWCELKHYAKRTPSISYAFGLYVDGELRGVCSYGTPASSTLLKGVCGPNWASNVVELNRLVLHGNQPNMASWFVAQTLKLLPYPTIVVSYADTSVGHVGYVYQATNFLYTGLSSKFVDPKVKGLEHQHHATYANRKSKKQLEEQYGKRLYWVERPRKHRYVIFIGSKVERKRMKRDLRYSVHPYPKGSTQITGDPTLKPVSQLPLAA